MLEVPLLIEKKEKTFFLMFRGRNCWRLFSPFLISPYLNLLNLTIPSRYKVMAARFPTSPSMLIHLFKSSTPRALRFLFF